jgi:UPF0271 protein
MRLNLNADLGESFGAWKMGSDAQMLEIVNSANIACGFHAGDPTVMKKTVALAHSKGVSMGAHPSFNDLQGFGRRKMDLSDEEIESIVAYQVGALMAMTLSAGAKLTHVKPHGALNNIACVDARVARAIARSTKAIDPTLILLAPALSVLAKEGEALGLPVINEVFADRTYQDDGQLTSRSKPGSVLHDPMDCQKHVLRMLDAGALVTETGKKLPVSIQSICVHGDGVEAVNAAKAVREGLQKAGVQLVTLPELLG